MSLIFCNKWVDLNNRSQFLNRQLRLYTLSCPTRKIVEVQHVTFDILTGGQVV